MKIFISKVPTFKDNAKTFYQRFISTVGLIESYDEKRASAWLTPEKSSLRELKTTISER